MKGLPCEVVRDLLPLYVEEAVEPKTRELVVEHLGECSSCSELLARLQEDEPDLSQIEEKIPEPDTFRKWHKRFRQGILGLAIVLIIGVIGVGFASYKAGTLADQDKYSTREVVKVLEKGGLQLKKSRKPFVAPQEALIGNIRPKVYEAYEDLCQIYIYEFPSTLERRKALEGLDNSLQEEETHPFSLEMDDRFILTRSYGSKNMLLVIFFGVTKDSSIEEMEKVTYVAPILGKAVFFHLNGGTQYVYYGEGENWKAKYYASYYEESWIDEKGYRRSEARTNHYPVFSFKGNPEELSEYRISFEHHGKLGFSSSGSTGQRNIDEEFADIYGGDLFLRDNYFGFSSGYYYEGIPCSFEAQWNGDKEEEFELELIKTRTVENAYEE
ncbi:MAG: DUF2275 domain-containing protein [Desulfitobacterium sp.]|nr:DUF2275 domain-containing protein [Desulfitobacterium sp.]